MKPLQKPDWRSVHALMARDLLVVRRSKSVILPIILVPLLLLVLLPAGICIAMPMMDTADTYQDLKQLMAMIPPEMQADFAYDTPQQTLLALILVHMFAPLFLILPMMVASTIAAGSFAGEKERKTLEALLYTPLSDLELILGKVMSAWLPALAVTIAGFLLYSIVVNAAGWPTMGRLYFPNALWVALVIWVAPAAAGLGLSAVVLISSKVSTFQDAYQLSGMVVLPVVLLMLGQVGGVIYLSLPFVLLIGMLLWLIDAGLLWLGVRTFRRTEIIARL